MDFNLVRKVWHRRDNGDGTFVHIIKTGRPCWRIVKNFSRSSYPGIAKDNQHLGWRTTVKEAIAACA